MKDGFSHPIDPSKVFSLGHFETRAVSPDEMYKMVSKDQSRVGYWFKNLVTSPQVEVTKNLKFSLLIIGGDIVPDLHFQLNNIMKVAFDLQLRKPTFEMGYYLWEFMCSLRSKDRKINGFDRLVVCHEPIIFEKTCPRIISVDNNLVVRGEIGGPGHCFGKETGFVFQSSV